MDEVMNARGYQSGENWLTRKLAGADHSERFWRERVHIPLVFSWTAEIRGFNEPSNHRRQIATSR
jgi:hypothetical protein